MTAFRSSTISELASRTQLSALRLDDLQNHCSQLEMYARTQRCSFESH